jgi:hypothetical protein
MMMIPIKIYFWRKHDQCKGYSLKSLQENDCIGVAQAFIRKKGEKTIANKNAKKSTHWQSVMALKMII